jgi:hypothetical protein
MSTPNIASNNDVREILELSIIPYIISAKKLKWQPFYMAHSINSYSRDMLVGLIGVGLSTPVMVAVSKALGGPVAANAAGESAAGLLENIPPGWKSFVIAALVISIALRVYVNQSKAEERAILAKTCSDDIRLASLNLTTILNKSYPDDDLLMMRNQIAAIAKNKAWPWDYDTAPGINNEVQKRVNDLVARFGAKWTGQPTGQQLPAPQPPVLQPVVQPN